MQEKASEPETSFSVMSRPRPPVQVCATQTPRPPSVRHKKARAGIKPALALQIE